MGSHAATQSSFARTPVVSTPLSRSSARQQNNVTVVEHRVVPSMTETFDQYYRRDYRRLVGLAYVLCGSHWAAEDLAQEALTEAHRKWSTVSGYDDPAGWVRRVMINKSTSRVRRLRTETKGLIRIGNRRRETIAPTERSLEVWKAVRDLPARQAQVTALMYWEDRSVAEIADILGISNETAKTHLKRARKALADRLDSHRAEGSER